MQLRLAKLNKAHVDRDHADNKTTVVARYGVRGYPTLIFTDASGNEVDRIVGGLHKPDEFAAKLDLIVKVGGRYPHYAKLIKEKPKDIELRYKRIVMATRARKYTITREDAPVFLELADSKTDKRYEEVLRAYGLSCSATNDPDGAIKTYERYLKMYPTSKEVPSALNLLGVNYRKKNRIDDAGKLYRRIIIEFGSSRYVGGACSFFKSFPMQLREGMKRPKTRSKYALKNWDEAQRKWAELKKAEAEKKENEGK